MVTILKNNPFNSHEIQINNVDLIVLYTDGFADQFGGPKGKKYKYKRLQDYFASNYTKDVSTISKELDIEFPSWKGDQDQIDDVCMMMVKIK